MDGNAAWTCPTAVSTYADIGGSDADIVQVELVGGELKRFSTHVNQSARRSHLGRKRLERVVYMQWDCNFSRQHRCVLTTHASLGLTFRPTI